MLGSTPAQEHPREMTDSEIIAALAARSPLPSVYAIISEFHCGYQKARRCLEAAIEKKVFTMGDF